MRTVGFDTSLYILSPIIGLVSDETIRVGNGVLTAEPFHAGRLGVRKCAVFYL